MCTSSVGRTVTGCLAKHQTRPLPETAVVAANASVRLRLTVMAEAAILDELAEVSRLLQLQSSALLQQRAQLAERETRLDHREAALGQQVAQLKQREAALEQQLDQRDSCNDSATTDQLQRLQAESKRRQQLVQQLRLQNKALHDELKRAHAETAKYDATNRRLGGRLEALQTWKQEAVVKLELLEQDRDRLQQHSDVKAERLPESTLNTDALSLAQLNKATGPLEASFSSIATSATDRTFAVRTPSSTICPQDCLRVLTAIVQQAPAKAQRRYCQRLCTPVNVQSLCRLQLWIWTLAEAELRRDSATTLSPLVCGTLLQLSDSSTPTTCRSSIKTLALVCGSLLESSPRDDELPLNEVISKLSIFVLTEPSGSARSLLCAAAYSQPSRSVISSGSSSTCHAFAISPHHRLFSCPERV